MILLKKKVSIEMPNNHLNQNKKINRKGGGRKGKFFFRRRSCYFTMKQITHIDYKDVDLLKRFISKSGQILPREVTGTKCKYQKHLAKAIKRARFLGMLGYTSRSGEN